MRRLEIAKRQMEYTPEEMTARRVGRIEELALPLLRRGPTGIPFTAAMRRAEAIRGRPIVSPPEEIKRRAPVVAPISGLLGEMATIFTSASIVGKLGVGAKVATKVPSWLKTISPYAARLAPETVKGVATWALGDLAREATRQYVEEKRYEPGRMIKEAAKGGLFGATLAIPGVIEATIPRVVAVGGTMAGWRAVEGYIEKGYLDRDDLMEAAAMGTVAAVLESLGAGTKTRKMVDKRLNEFYRESTIQRIRAVPGKPLMEREKAEAIAGFLDHLGALKWQAKLRPSIIRELPAELREIGRVASQIEKHKMAKTFADTLIKRAGTSGSLWQAFFEMTSGARPGFVRLGAEVGKPVPAIPKELEPLAKEARKYESAGEFITGVVADPEVKPQLRKLLVGKPSAKKALTDFYNLVTEGVKPKVEKPTPLERAIPALKKPGPSIEQIRAEREAVEAAEVYGEVPDDVAEYLADRIAKERAILEIGKPMAEEYAKVVGIIKFAGSKKSRKTGELFSEHIGSGEWGLGVGTDEIATARGVTENELMAQAGQDAGRIGGARVRAVAARAPKTTKIGQKVRKWAVERLGLEEVKGIKALEGVVTVTPPVVKPGDVLRKERAFLRGLAKRSTALQHAERIAKAIGKTTREAWKKNKATDWQVRRIRTLRKRAVIKNKELKLVLDDLTNRDALSKLTRDQAGDVITFLQPRNWEKLEREVSKVKAELAREKREVLVGKKVVGYPEEVPAGEFATDHPLEARHGGIGGINNTLREINNLSKSIARLPTLKEKKPSPLAFLAPYLPESISARLTRIKKEFHTPLRATLRISKNFERDLKSTLEDVFEGLTPEEAKQVLFIQAGGPKKGVSNKVISYADYLNEIFTAHLGLINRLRDAAGRKALRPKRPTYIPYIIDKNIAEAVDLYDKNKFWLTRTKTFKEFSAGLFEHDPQRIINIFTRSASDYLKKNIYGAFLLDRYQELSKISGPAATYGKVLVDMDIYNMVSPSERLIRMGVGINDRIGSIFPKRVPVDKKLADAIINTHWGKELRENIKKGYLEVPRFQLPNLSRLAMTAFYHAALDWNLGFVVLNRTQPFAAIPFIGTKETLLGRLKMYQTLFPWNKTARENYLKILEKSGYEYQKVAAGEEIEKINRVVSFTTDISEFMNRVETAIGAELFINEAEGRVGKTLSKADKDKVTSAFSAFIHFLHSKGYSPAAQRTTAGRWAYIFSQYPLNQFEVLGEMYKSAFKDDGARKFWTMLAEEGGASPKAVKFFEQLPNSSKANVFRIILALAMPPAILYLLSRSWNVAQRAVPWLPRISMWGMISALMEFFEDPEEGMDRIREEFKRLPFTNPVAIRKLTDAIDIAQTGIIQTGVTGKPLFVKPEEALKVAIFGRSALKEYEKRFPSPLARILGLEKIGPEMRALKKERKGIRRTTTDTAVRIIKDLRKAGSDEEAKRIEAQYREQGVLTREVAEKITEIIKEEKLGITGIERGMKTMNVGDRAKLIINELRRKPSDEEARRYERQLYLQGVLTADVAKEIRRLIEEGY